jgi:hypothetical protein
MEHRTAHVGAVVRGTAGLALGILIPSAVGGVLAVSLHPSFLLAVGVLSAVGAVQRHRRLPQLAAPYAAAAIACYSAMGTLNLVAAVLGVALAPIVLLVAGIAGIALAVRLGPRLTLTLAARR